MNRFSQQLKSFNTQHLAQQAAAAAQAAGASIVAGLRTCDERSSRLKDQFEIRIEHPSSADPHAQGHDGTGWHRGSFSLSVPSTAMALAGGPKAAVPEVNVWGNHSFEFSVRLADSGPSIGCLVVTTRKHSNPKNSFSPLVLDHESHGSMIQVRCRWKRKIGRQCLDIPGVFGTVYPISADDVASTVIVEATSLDPMSKGQIAYAELGPFDLDSATRKNLDNYLAVGSTRFMVRLQNNSDDSRVPVVDLDEGLSLDVSAEEIKVVQPGPMNVGYLREWRCRYGSSYPSITLNHHNLTQFELKLGSEAQDTLRLNTITRNQRDLLALTVRCFHGRQYVLNSALLQAVGLQANRKLVASKLTVELPSQEDDSNDMEAPPIDLLVVVQSLNAQLHHSLQKQEKCIKERDRAKTEKDALEQDIEATIAAYQQLIAQVAVLGEESSSRIGTPETIALDIQQRAAQVAELETKLAEAKLQAEKYIEELELLRRDYRALETRAVASHQQSNNYNPSHAFSSKDYSLLRTASHTKFGFPSSQSCLETQMSEDTMATVELRDHLQKLQQAHVNLLEETDKKDKKLETLRVVGKPTPSSSSAFYSALPVIDEAARLDLEEMTNQKVSLERQLRHLQSENKELTENFLYIKTKYDALQASQEQVEDRLAQSTEVSLRTINEETQTRQALEQKCDNLFRELQTVKAIHDTVLVEKNRLVKKCTSLNREIDKNRNQSGSQTQTLMAVNQKLTAEKLSAEEQLKKLESIRLESLAVEQLKQQLAEKCMEVDQLQKENLLLKSRLRKLAINKTPTDE